MSEAPGLRATEDEAIVEKARNGDRRALEQLLLLHFDRVHAVCRRMLCNDLDAEDATQDTLMSAVRALPHFDGQSSFGTWIYRIATNTCIDELRRRKRRPLQLVGDSIDTEIDRLSPSPADVVASRIDVDAALATLPEEYRAAVVLRDVCDLPYEEIARVLEVPLGTVRSRISRGRAALADLLGNSAPPPSVQDDDASGSMAGSPQALES
ncbi:MAG: RNA polymerase sigma factor, partial [Acidimicrobiales bacterium]